MSTSNSALPDGSLKVGKLASPELLEDTVKLAQAQLTTAAAVPQAIWEANLAILTEMLGFVSHRLRAQAAFCNNLGHCKELSEAIEAQRAYAQGMTGDYSQEVDKLSDIARKNIATLSAIGTQYVSAVNGEKNLAA